MKIIFQGFDDLQKQLSNLEKAANEVAEKYNGSIVDISELLTCDFMEAHTEYSDYAEWFEDGGYLLESQEDFDALSEKDIDSYVQKTTDFDSWEDMLGEAATEQITKDLGI